jgi:hypothetical protein
MGRLAAYLNGSLVALGGKVDLIYQEFWLDRCEPHVLKRIGT